MFVDQPADAFTFVGDYWRKQLKGKLSPTVSQAVSSGHTAGNPST